MQETWVRFLGGEDPLEKEMAPHSSILAWEIPWTDKPGGLQSMALQRVRHNWVPKPPPPRTSNPAHSALWAGGWNDRLALNIKALGKINFPTEMVHTTIAIELTFWGSLDFLYTQTSVTIASTATSELEEVFLSLGMKLLKTECCNMDRAGKWCWVF